jgi:predicted nucleic acid-binding protein
MGTDYNKYQEIRRIRMKKLKIYLDTSAIGYLDEEASPKEMSDMRELWKLIRYGEYSAVISDITLDEIRQNKKASKVETLLNYVAEISYSRISINDEISKIAEMVRQNGLIAADKHYNDRLHIGCAINSECDVIVSMNFKHLVNVVTIRGVRAISILESNRSIDIVSPASLRYREGAD